MPFEIYECLKKKYQTPSFVWDNGYVWTKQFLIYHYSLQKKSSVFSSLRYRLVIKNTLLCSQNLLSNGKKINSSFGRVNLGFNWGEKS